MNITVDARHMEATDSIHGYVDKKVSKLPRYYSNIKEIEVVLDKEGDNAVAEIIAHAKKKRTFVASAQHENIYGAIDGCLDKITEQLRRFKDKVRDHQGPSHEQTMGGGGL
ncbi:MAG: ribosome hibernation-promoting factor, HPF/YfiA family [Phycisphaerae bacterium]